MKTVEIRTKAETIREKGGQKEEESRKRGKNRSEKKNRVRVKDIKGDTTGTKIKSFP